MFKIVKTSDVCVEKLHLNALELKLPATYRDFLRKFNGGSPKNDSFKSIDGKPDVGVEGFCALVFQTVLLFLKSS